MALKELLDELKIPNLPQTFGDLCLESTLKTALSVFYANVDKDLIEHEIFCKGDSVTKAFRLTVPHKLSEFCLIYSKNYIIAKDKTTPSFLDNILEVLKDAYSKDVNELFFEYSLLDNFKQKKTIVQRFVLFKNDNNELCTFSILNDVSIVRQKQEAEYNEYLQNLAYTDPVTGGNNYTCFKEKVKENNKPGFIICVDIHNFKVINTTCGISKGDEYIKKIWECIVSMIGPDDEAAHINADHFVIYLSTLDEAQAERTVKNISMSMMLLSAELNVPQLHPYFGISSWDTTTKIELAYSQTVEAKHKIHNNLQENFAFFTESDTKRLIQEKQMEDDFEASLAKKEFLIYYQPKYSPSTRKLMGAEALIRWQKSDGTIVPPGMFIPLFENNGLIKQLDEYVFRNVCQQQKIWKDEGLNIVPVSVNVSRVSLYYKNIVERYKRILEESEISSEYVPIEITESAAVNNKDIQSIAQVFHDAGFHLHLDDFGSGYSSLASLNTLHLDTLKIDKSLVDFIGNSNGERLLEHTVALAKDLGIHVTAEGVEEEAQNRYLWHIGCDSIQGYYFSKPVPQPDYEKILEENKLTQADKNMEIIINSVAKIKHALSKKSTYEYIVNLTDNTLVDYIGISDWTEQAVKDGNNYETAVEFAAQNFILDDFKQMFNDFLDRNALIQNFDGSTKTKTIYFRRKFKENISWMKLSTTLFKPQDTDIICMYASLTQVD